MKKIVLTFGLISGAILAAMIVLMVPSWGKGDFDKGEIVGYSTMVLAFLLVFFGIRTYREDIGGGVITFGKAFQVGICITLISCAVYVISWEIVFFNFIPDFADKYAAHLIEKMRKEGATDVLIAETAKKMAEFKELYKNPLINAGMTFLEAFPIGLIVTLLSAAFLRKKTTPGAPSAATAIA